MSVSLLLRFHGCARRHRRRLSSPIGWRRASGAHARCGRVVADGLIVDLRMRAAKSRAIGAVVVLA
jgi:hypothetical protein